MVTEEIGLEHQERTDGVQFEAMRLAAHTVAMCLLVANLAYPQFNRPWSEVVRPESEHLKETILSIKSCMSDKGGITQIDDLGIGLLAGWENWRLKRPGATPPPPPREYQRDLERDLKACKEASGMHNSAKRRAILRAVSLDVSIKAADCKARGMWRLVPIDVETIRNDVEVRNWVIVYKWQAGDLRTAEISLPGLSPTTWMAPPGQILLYAQKTSNGHLMKSNARMISTTPGQPRTKCVLEVP